MLSARRIPPPPPKKKPTLNHSKKQNYISEKNVICFRLTRSLLNTSLHYPNNLNHPKETLTPHQKLHPPPPIPTFIRLLNNLNHLKKFLTLLKNTTSSQKILPPPHTKKISICQIISNPSQNISTSPKCFLFILALYSFKSRHVWLNLFIKIGNTSCDS